MKRAGFALMAFALLAVVAGVLLRNRVDDEPSPEGEARQPTRATPAACEALAPLQSLLAATVNDVGLALEAEDGAGLEAAVDRAIERRPDFLDSIANLEGPVAEEYRPDVQASAAAAGELLDRLAAIDLGQDQSETVAQVRAEVVTFQNDPTTQASIDRLNDYFSRCPPA